MKHRGNKHKKKVLGRIASQRQLCPSKGHFATEAEAKRAMEEMTLRPWFVVREGRELRVYRCTACGLWQIGNTPLRGRVSQRRKTA